MYEYGRHLGLAFQIVDDILDFTQSTEQLGKPQGQDLASGNLTAPTLFALAMGLSESSLVKIGSMNVTPQAVEDSKALLAMIESEFIEEGSLQRAIQLVHSTGGLAAAQKLAKEEGSLALAALKILPDGPAKRSLELMVEYVLFRIF